VSFAGEASNPSDSPRFNVAGGFLQVVDDVVTALSERAAAA
jgi:hypothetical protein